MSNRIERAFSFGLTLAACAIAVAFVHREFFPKPSRNAAPESFSYVSNWKSLADAGVFIGDSAAPVRVTIFSDFECPFCKRADSVYRDVKTKNASTLTMLFIHFPLSQHRFAMPAARAAECARAQGRFAAVHDALLDKQDSLGLKSWISYAKDGGVTDTLAFAKCTSAQTEIPLVKRGLEVGKGMGVHATPDVMVNGWRFPIAPSKEELQQAIEDLIHNRIPQGISGHIDTTTIKAR